MFELHYSVDLKKLNDDDHRDFVCTEYQLFRDMIGSILGRFNVNNNTERISIITFV